MSKEKSLEEYLSSIKHDLRCELAPIRELMSIVLDGLGNKDCAKCFDILKPALGSADRLNKLIEELFSTSAFKSVLKNQDNAAKLNKSGKDDLEKSKNELISMIAHMVRTPLTVLKENLALVLDEIPGKLNTEQRELLVGVKKNADRLIQSSEEILQKPWDKILIPSKSNISNEAKDKEA